MPKLCQIAMPFTGPSNRINATNPLKDILDRDASDAPQASTPKLDLDDDREPGPDDEGKISPDVDRGRGHRL